MRAMLLILFLSLSCSVADAHEQPDKEACKLIKEKIRNIQSKMRAGYTRAQGERMENKLRKLRIARGKKC